MDICSGSEESDMEYLPELVVEPGETECLELIGRRIVDIDHLVKEISHMATHYKVCTSGRFQLRKELKKGLFSRLKFQCDNCDKINYVTTEPVDRENELNDAIVWGAVSVGIGFSQTEELLGIMDVPSIGSKKFRKHETRVGKVRT